MIFIMSFLISDRPNNHLALCGETFVNSIMKYGSFTI